MVGAAWTQARAVFRQRRAARFFCGCVLLGGARGADLVGGFRSCFWLQTRNRFFERFCRDLRSLLGQLFLQGKDLL